MDNKKQTKNKPSFKYKLRSHVVYLGNFNEGYNEQVAKIIARSTKKQVYKWYLIEFNDGVQQEVKEEWIADLQYEIGGLDG